MNLEDKLLEAEKKVEEIKKQIEDKKFKCIGKWFLCKNTFSVFKCNKYHLMDRNMLLYHELKNTLLIELLENEFKTTCKANEKRT